MMDIRQPTNQFPYDKYTEREGLQVHRSVIGVDDLTKLPRAPWKSTGGNATFHGPGAILLGLDGEGYVLAWPSSLGPHPYQDGHADKVGRVNWSRNSIYSPPNAYYHQHLNSGPTPAKHIAVYGAKHPLGVHNLQDGQEGFVGYVSFREGGTLIEYEDEDPRVRADFEAELAEKGIKCTMPPVTYR